MPQRTYIQRAWWDAQVAAAAARPGVLLPEYTVLADVLAAGCAPGVAVVGLSGPQGAGKSTLVKDLVSAFVVRGRAPVALALDDYYLPAATRQTLARQQHPLLATRGVPGTHDVQRLLADIGALAAGQACTTPVFDKGLDDRLPAADWRRHAPGTDLVILEGWCVGVPAAADAAELAAPINTLETREDADGRWRRGVDAALAGPYARLNQLLDALLFLATPDFAASRRWRAQQEQALPPQRRMDAAALERFMAHYERLACRALRLLRGTADGVVELDAGHRIGSVALGGAFRVDSALPGYPAQP